MKILKLFYSHWYLLAVFGLVALSIECVLASSVLEITPSSQFSGIDLVSSKPMKVNLREGSLGTIVVFLSTRCPCSGSHIECELKGTGKEVSSGTQPKKQKLLAELANEFAPLGFKFLGIHSNADESLEEAKQYFRDRLPFPVLQDDQSVIAKQFQAYKTPHAYVVSPQLKILFAGGISNSHNPATASRIYLKEVLQSIVKGQKPPETEVRVLGCKINRPEDLK
jgi:hypothetical protein